MSQPKQPVMSLTSGSVETPFDEIVTTIESHGFCQSIYEVERLNSPVGRAKATTDGAAIVLRPCLTRTYYPAIQPGDQVQCSGLGEGDPAAPVLYRVRRMAEGFSRRNMTVWPAPPEKTHVR